MTREVECDRRQLHRLRKLTGIEPLPKEGPSSDGLAETNFIAP